MEEIAEQSQCMRISRSRFIELPVSPDQIEEIRAHKDNSPSSNGVPTGLKWREEQRHRWIQARHFKHPHSYQKKNNYQPALRKCPIFRHNITHKQNTNLKVPTASKLGETHTAWSKKKKRSHRPIFCWTAFSFGYSTDLLDVTRCISIKSCINCLTQSHTDDGKFWLLCKVFSSTSQRFTMKLKSGLCGGQFSDVWWRATHSGDRHPQESSDLSAEVITHKKLFQQKSTTATTDFWKKKMHSDHAWESTAGTDCRSSRIKPCTIFSSRIWRGVLTPLL